MTHANEDPGRTPDAADTPALTQYLTFTLSGKTYGIGISVIREIIEYRVPTALTTMPDSVRGVINLRGKRVPVLDPIAHFGEAPGKVGKRCCIVIVEAAVCGGGEFARSRQFIFAAAGITLSPAKMARVCGRLARRLAACGVACACGAQRIPVARRSTASRCCSTTCSATCHGR